jgi:hypothetical protein
MKRLEILLGVLIGLLPITLSLTACGTKERVPVLQITMDGTQTSVYKENPQLEVKGNCHTQDDGSIKCDTVTYESCGTEALTASPEQSSGLLSLIGAVAGFLIKALVN